MKQILIEKYIKPSETEKYVEFSIEYWLDKYDDKHSFMGQPAEVWYYTYSGIVSGKFWYKNSKKHRDRGLPAEMYYESEKVVDIEFYKNGKKIKQN